MKFEVEQGIEVLGATPVTLRGLLGGVSEVWTASSGDESAWEAFDVLGHLIHGEVTDWVPRGRIILSDSEERVFETFDRMAQFEHSKGKSMAQLLDEFAQLRGGNIAQLRSWNLSEQDLGRKGTHPELGEVTLSQLLATWVVHDLNHISQIASAMSRRYAHEVGPWREYLGILN